MVLWSDHWASDILKKRLESLALMIAAFSSSVIADCDESLQAAHPIKPMPRAICPESLRNFRLVRFINLVFKKKITSCFYALKNNRRQGFVTRLTKLKKYVFEFCINSTAHTPFKIRPKPSRVEGLNFENILPKQLKNSGLKPCCARIFANCAKPRYIYVFII